MRTLTRSLYTTRHGGRVIITNVINTVSTHAFCRYATRRFKINRVTYICSVNAVRIFTFRLYATSKSCRVTSPFIINRICTITRCDDATASSKNCLIIVTIIINTVSRLAFCRYATRHICLITVTRVGNARCANASSRNATNSVDSGFVAVTFIKNAIGLFARRVNIT